MSLKEIKEEYFDFVQAALGMTVLAAIPLGFLYLLSYSVANHVPIPLSLSELPTLLLAVMALGTVFASVFLGIIFLPSIARFRVFGNTFSYMYGLDTFSPAKELTDGCDAEPLVGTRMPDKLQQQKNKLLFLFTLAFPLFLFLTLLLTLSLVPEEYRIWRYVGAGLGLVAGIISVVACIAKNFPKERIVEVHATAWSLLLVCAYWSILVLLLILRSLTMVPLVLPTWGEIAVVVATVIAMLVILYFMVVPRFSGPPLPTGFWVTVEAMMVLLPPLISPVSEALCGFALRAMRIGGGYETVYTLKREAVDAFPCPTLIDKGKNQTVKVQVVLDLGERIYLKLPGGISAKVCAISRDVTSGQML